MKKRFVLLSFSLALTVVLASEITSEVVDGKIGGSYSKTVNSTHQVIFRFDNISRPNNSALRVFSYSGDWDYPLGVVVRQEKDILSWELPLVIGNTRYGGVNRTLCPSAGDGSVLISVMTMNKLSMKFTISMAIQEEFNIELGQPLKVKMAPSAPIYYKFDWPQGLDYALIKFQSNDDRCMILSVQNASCPVYDMDWNVKFEGQYQTVDSLTGLAITRELFPYGLFLVMVVKSDDKTCHEYRELNQEPSSLINFLQGSWIDMRLKTGTITISSQLTSDEYILATFGALGLFLLMYVLVFIVSCAIFCKSRSAAGSQTQQNVDEESSLVHGSEETAAQVVHGEVHHIEGDDENAIAIVPSTSYGAINHPEVADDSSIDSDIDMLPDIEFEKEIFRTKKYPFVSDLARKSSRFMSKKISLYHWNLWTVAIFYSLPVIQLMVTYQKVANSTGDMDMCYYNFLCAHPLGVLSDFNHVYSNLGYVMLGALFMLVTRFKDRRSHKRDRVFSSGNVQRLNEPQKGIPEHFGLFYAMGLGLIMEGVMSACYHVCPNHTNFQFDTAFMYTISILILLKIYQTRHPDVTANAYTAFGVLACIIFIGVVGVINGSVYFWIIFTFIHVFTCLSLSLQIYYMGRFKVDSGIFKRIGRLCYNEVLAIWGGHWYGLRPIYVDRLILLVILNGVNWGLSVYGVTTIAKAGGDFASFLLAILITNVMLYTCFYIVMKLRHRERITLQPAIYILLSMFSWAGAMYFFFNKSTTWTLSPAQSRHYNKECVMFHFYDNHDIWHFLSATSLFLSFMILLTLDDDLKNVPREKIPVF